MEYSSSELRALGIAFAVILLSVFAIAAFALSSLAIFYILAFFAVVLGFYLAFLTSKEAKQPKAKASIKRPKEGSK
ncbi:MAG: hypothetical protein ACP5T4_02555 [Candidatus Micrarchaeia archaeon]